MPWTSQSILFIIIFGLIITLFFPFTRGGNKELSNFDNVISSTIGSSEEKYDTKITEIALLGAHDAFSNGITFNSDPNVNEGGIVNNFVEKMTLNQAIDKYFDKSIDVKSKIEDCLKMPVKADYNALHEFLASRKELIEDFCKKIEVVKPKELIDELKKISKSIKEKYG